MSKTGQPKNFRGLIENALSTDADIKLCLLYGSAATGRLRADSDLDIGIAGDVRLPNDQLRELSSRLAEATGRNVDLLDLNAVSGAILHQALTLGKIIFVRDHSVYASIIKRMLFDQADMMPYINRMLKVRREAFLAS